jgi:hypothetical protein
METLNTTQDTHDLFNQIIDSSAGSTISEIQAKIIDMLMIYPQADYNLLLNQFQLLKIDQKLKNEKELRDLNQPEITKIEWFSDIQQYKNLSASINKKYGVINSSTDHWFWGRRSEWSNTEMGDIDPISGEFLSEFFADRPMSNFQIWYEFGKCPECRSINLEKSDGINLVGICLDCNSRCDYNPDYRYFLDLPSVDRPIEVTIEEKLISFAKSKNWV